MNKRLWELYWQAKVPHTAIDPSNNMPYETTIFSADKFAELIVRECVGKIQLHNRMDEVTEQWVYDNLVSDVKEHFGVE